MIQSQTTTSNLWNINSSYLKNQYSNVFYRLTFYNQFLKILLLTNLKLISNLKYSPLLTYFKQSFNFSLTTRWQTFKTPNLTSYTKKSTTNFLTLQKLPSYTKLFLTYLEYAQTSFTFFYKPHFAYKLIFNISLYKSLLNINLKKFLAKWSSTLLLFSNFAYFNIQTSSFGNKFLWKEILAVNYKNTLTKMLFFKQINKKIFFSDLNWNEKFITIFKRFKKSHVQNLIFWDLTNHKTNLFYFKKMNFFLMALIPLHQNPWDVHYAIPVFSATLLIQYYFLNFYIYIYTFTKNHYFSMLKKSWYLLYL
jgi:hypothetical protein